MTTTQPASGAAPSAAAAGAAARRGVRAPKLHRSGPLTPYLFLAPYLVLFLTFVVAPIVFGVWISLHEWDFLLPGKPFVGLENYTDLFEGGTATSGRFWESMKATGLFTLYSVPFLLAIPLALALLLNRKFRGRNFFRAVYFAPYVLGVSVVGILWGFLLDPNVGLLNFYLDKIGIDRIAWTTSLPWAWVALVGMTVWWTLGFNTVIYLAGLQDIPRELYEAAAVDGAGRWHQFRHVTMPGLRPVLAFVTTVTILASANMFGQAYIVTEGRPGDETRTAIMLITEEGLRNYSMGSAAAMSFILTVLLAMVSIVNLAVFRDRGDG